MCLSTVSRSRYDIPDSFLCAFRELTLQQNIVASSVAWQNRHNLNPPSEDPVGDFTNFLPGSSIDDPASFPGLFRIPICKSPRGDFVSSVNTNYDRNFPCMCGVVDVRTGDGHDEYFWDDTPAFMDATGLKYSRGFADVCKSDMKCKEDKGKQLIDMYERPDPLGWTTNRGLEHPFKKCEDPQAGDPRVWGHTLRGEPHFVVQDYNHPYNWRSDDHNRESEVETEKAPFAVDSTCDGTENGLL